MLAPDIMFVVGLVAVVFGIIMKSAKLVRIGGLILIASGVLYILFGKFIGILLFLPGVALWFAAALFRPSKKTRVISRT